MQPEANDRLVENVRAGHLCGWTFTPLNGKKPYLKGWSSRPKESLQQAVEWASKGNVGLRTGRSSGIVVIDADPGADLSSLNLPETVTALTGRAGARHVYFQHDGPLGNSAGKLGDHIDFKGDGGQVVFPGSVHPETSVVYAWAEGHSPGEIEMAELPAHVVALLVKPPPQAVGAAAQGAGWPYARGAICRAGAAAGVEQHPQRRRGKPQRHRQQCRV